ncbi:threonine-phosphate decarboxylase CobD [Breoghania sp. L-A4]|uniref:threonine-phosphate decarboxylase CobD n=1 Tax=Breoghania sp. L-A4 TaxID=2304600 RepID=UPI000E35B00D|nr:threonine-phosphate decarboxylase CobD [Breoghania sp. L-A4]AXS40907.1 threonine-phosphate decarboxylase [Breoghania sp. L-A4]
MRHGGDLSEAARHFGGSRNDWLDLSTGINPHAWQWPESRHGTTHAPGERNASETPRNGPQFTLAADAWSTLPGDAAMSSLLDAARGAYRVPDAFGVTAAPGTESILARLPTIAPQGDVVVLSPTYSSHAGCWRGAHRPVREILSLDEIGAADRIVVLVNPNNPDGRSLAPEALLDVARMLAARDGLLIIDEAFADVAPQTSVLPHASTTPVAVLRSFGKFFGLAGLRLGFLAGPPALCASLSEAIGGWSVSGPALEIGAAALRDTAWQTEMRQTLIRDSAALDAVLARHGLPIAGGTTLFRLIRHEHAHALHAALARRHIWTRAFDYAPHWLRIGLPGTDAALTRFDTALSQSLDELPPADDRRPPRAGTRTEDASC